MLRIIRLARVVVVFGFVVSTACSGGGDGKMGTGGSAASGGGGGSAGHLGAGGMPATGAVGGTAGAGGAVSTGGAPATGGVGGTAGVGGAAGMSGKAGIGGGGLAGDAGMGAPGGLSGTAGFGGIGGTAAHAGGAGGCLPTPTTHNDAACPDPGVLSQFNWPVSSSSCAAGLTCQFLVKTGEYPCTQPPLVVQFVCCGSGFLRGLDSSACSPDAAADR